MRSSTPTPRGACLGRPTGALVRSPLTPASPWRSGRQRTPIERTWSSSAAVREVRLGVDSCSCGEACATSCCSAPRRSRTSGAAPDAQARRSRGCAVPRRRARVSRAARRSRSRRSRGGRRGGSRVLGAARPPRGRRVVVERGPAQEPPRSAGAGDAGAFGVTLVGDIHAVGVRERAFSLLVGIAGEAGRALARLEHSGAVRADRGIGPTVRRIHRPVRGGCRGVRCPRAGGWSRRASSLYRSTALPLGRRGGGGRFQRRAVRPTTASRSGHGSRPLGRKPRAGWREGIGSKVWRGAARSCCGRFAVPRAGVSRYGRTGAGCAFGRAGEFAPGRS